MVTVYLVRHCEAMGNSMKIIQGHVDLDITEAGAMQLERLGNRFKDIHIDRVYSSPLMRARKTAEAIAGPKGLPVIDNAGLIELHFGVFEGMRFAQVFSEYADLEHVWQHKPEDFCAPNGEKMRELYDRIWNAFAEIVRENSGKTIVVSSHGVAVRNLICRITKGSVEKLNEVAWSENTAVSKFVFDDEMNGYAEFINDVSHLPEECLPLSSRMNVMMEAEK